MSTFGNNLFAAYYAMQSRIPTDGLVFYHSLDQWSTTAATGQTMEYMGTLETQPVPTASTYKGIPCCLFENNSYWCATTIFKQENAVGQTTISCWVASKTALAIWKGSDGIVCVRNQKNTVGDNRGLTRFGVDWQNGKQSLTVGTHDNTTTFYGYATNVNDTDWHHYAVTLNVTKGSKYNNQWNYKAFFDGIYRQEETHGLGYGALGYTHIGCRRTSGTYAFYIAGVRLYNRILSDTEIAALASEYTQTT